MSTTSRACAFAAALILLTGTTALAQVTASLRGVVTTDGTPLPGVSVTITSPQLQGSRGAVSDNNGGYAFQALPPGKYGVKFEAAGMDPVTKTAIVVLNVSNRVDAAMVVATMAEAITVTATAPAVLETTQIAANIDAELMDELPVNRTPLAAAELAPGVVSNGMATFTVSISGSPTYGNLVMVNGVSITEGVRTQALPLFVEDAIQETTILTGAVSAEWGRFTGGVVNSITRSGGNEFSGSFRDSFWNPQWQQERPLETISADELNQIYAATLGGYVMRDRIWFFLAGQYTKAESSQQTYRTGIEYPITGDERRVEYKVTGQITPKHNIVASYLDYESNSTNTRFSSMSYDLYTLSDRSDPMSLLSVHYNGIVATNLLLEGHYADQQYDIGVGNGAQYTDLIRGTVMLNRSDGNARFNSPTFCGVCDVESRDSDGATLKANYYLSSAWLGTHSLVGGVDTFSEHRHANNYQSGSDYRIFFTNVVRVPGSTTPLLSSDGQVYPVTGTNTYIRWTPIVDPSTSESDLASDSLFVNDRWDLSSRWTFNVGLRYDKNDAVDADGNVSSDDEAFSPRLTAIYDLRGDGRHRFSASYNRYVSRIVAGLGTAAETSGQPAAIDFRYGGPAINPAGTPAGQLLTARQAAAVMFDWFTANGGPDNPALLLPGGAFVIPGADTIFPETVASPSVDEVAVGYGMQFSGSGYFKIDYIQRDWSDFYAYRIDRSTPTGTTATGVPFDMATIENTNDVVREYEGIQVQGAWRPRRFNIGLSYTWSELRGTDAEGTGGNGASGNTPAAVYYPEVLDFERSNPVGWIAGDQRHVARAWIGYDVPAPAWLGAINLSFLQSYNSGRPYSAAGLIDALHYAGAPDPAALGYYNAPLEWAYYFEGRGNYRTDDISSTDIAVNYAHRLIGGLELFAQGEMLNVFDERGVVAVNTTIYTVRNGQSLCPGCVAFNPFTETPVEGKHWKKAPNFGKPTAGTNYQPAVSYRFSVGLRF
ncbi:MAG: TonB-dependent receptor [Thermoanaerobaculia bacterium]|nr:TonB-dependent receptor [Thermoanaerobaculia bacterium]